MSAASDIIRQDLKDYCPASNLAFNEKVRALIKSGKTIYHFGFGQAPFPVMESMVQALKEHAGENAYLPVAGIPELREAICRFHTRYDKLEGLDPDRVIVGPGTKELTFRLINIFNGGTNVLLVSPSWTTYRPQSLLACHAPYIIPSSHETEWRLTAHALEQTVLENKLTDNKLLILCNPDNPTGTNYKAEHMKAISEVCRKHKIIIVSDEIYARLHYKHQHDTIARYYPEGTVLSSGMSKWASAGGWRLGYHIYPKELKPLLESVKSATSHTFSCVAAPIQFAVAKGLQDEEAVDHYILHTTRIMAAVGDYCYRELTSVGVTCVKSTGGYYIFPDFEVVRGALNKRGLDTCQQMCDLMFEEVSVALMAGGQAFLRPEKELTTRLCYVNFDGKRALEESRRMGLDFNIDDSFVAKYCTPTFDGIQAIKNWVLTQLKKYS